MWVVALLTDMVLRTRPEPRAHLRDRDWMVVGAQEAEIGGSL